MYLCAECRVLDEEVRFDIIFDIITTIASIFASEMYAYETDQIVFVEQLRMDNRNHGFIPTLDDDAQNPTKMMMTDSKPTSVLANQVRVAQKKQIEAEVKGKSDRKRSYEEVHSFT